MRISSTEYGIIERGQSDILWHWEYSQTKINKPWTGAVMGDHHTPPPLSQVKEGLNCIKLSSTEKCLHEKSYKIPHSASDLCSQWNKVLACREYSLFQKWYSLDNNCEIRQITLPRY